jgi:quercetin dioxygenase-like cupin family protein
VSGSPIRSRIALASRDSGGTIGIVENLVQSRWQPPLHHHAFDETFCILDGELTFQLGADRVVGRRGDTFHLLVGELLSVVQGEKALHLRARTVR